MNKFKSTLSIGCLIALLATSGCNSNPTVPAMANNVESAPGKSSAISAVVSQAEDKKPNVDWEVIIKKAKLALLNKADYPFIKDLSIQVDDNEKRIQFSAVVDDSTDPNTALSYVDTLMRQLNLFASQSDTTISEGTKDSYGGLYNYYSTSIGIAPYSKLQEPKYWFVYDTIGAKVQTKHKVKLQKEYR